jgi:hypothetical protein
VKNQSSQNQRQGLKSVFKNMRILKFIVAIIILTVLSFISIEFVYYTISGFLILKGAIALKTLFLASGLSTAGFMTKKLLDRENTTSSLIKSLHTESTSSTSEQVIDPCLLDEDSEECSHKPNEIVSMIKSSLIKKSDSEILQPHVQPSDKNDEIYDYDNDDFDFSYDDTDITEDTD